MSEQASTDKISTLKVPPHSIEAEQAVLGALMLDNSRWDNVQEILLDTDFYRMEHRLVYAAMQQQMGQNKPIDVITLSETLRSSNQLKEAGGVDYLGELVSSNQSVANIVAYAGIIKERAILRKLISAGHGIADKGYNPDGRDSNELLHAAEEAVLGIRNERPSDGGPQPLKPILKSAVDRIERLFHAKGEITGITTGFADLDTMTSGLQDSDLVIVAGRPSMGKCIVRGSRLIDPDTGKRVVIDDIVKQQSGNVLSLGNNLKLTKMQPGAYLDDGLKPTFRVTTKLGREIETTLTHPFLTGNGWKPLSQIQVGERIGVPRKIPLFGKSKQPVHQIKLLAYLLADGSLTQPCPGFTNGNERLLEEFAQCVNAFGGLKVERIDDGKRTPSLRVSADRSLISDAKAEFANALKLRMSELGISARQLANSLGISPNTITYWRQGLNVPQGETLSALTNKLDVEMVSLLPYGKYSASKNVKNKLTRWLESISVWGKSALCKTVPELVFTLPREQMAIFLNRLFACDGSIYIQNSSQCVLSYTSSSKQLARDVQHLLLRFGILGRLRHRKMKYQETYRDAWELVISHQDSLRIFLDEIGIFGKETGCINAGLLLSEKRTHSNVDSLPESVCDYILSLKGNATWQSIYKKAGLNCPKNHNPHLASGCRRLVSRGRAKFYAELFNDKYLENMAQSDLYWDTVVSIEATGIKQVYDITVPKNHNFVAEDILVHNTSFAMNMVESVLLKHKGTDKPRPVLVFSLEMPADSLIIRMLSSLGRIDQSHMRNGKLGNDDWEKLDAAISKLSGKPLYIDDTSGLSPGEMRARARRVAREHENGLGMIMVDYLQLMQIKGSSENRTGEISEISRSLKLMAREFKCPVVALSQLNRSLEQRPNKRPVMSDLRESGAIEQDADLILFVYRHEVYEPDRAETKGVAEIIIGKQRNGPIGTVNLSFIGKHTRFENFMPMSGTTQWGGE